MEHELYHVEEYWRYPPISWVYHPIMYVANNKYRLKSELGAYSAQLSFIDDKMKNKYKDMFIEMIYEDYNINYDKKFIEKLFNEQIYED